ncbi:MAG TPA: diguanylate cyclase [Myxococcaceae bacterium]|nr:diguanylate cyclase [Myxococcaceae bacterium]
MSLFEQVAARARALLSDDTDQALVRARTSGEVLVAALRLVLVVGFVAVTLTQLSEKAWTLEVTISAAAVVYALLLLGVAKTFRASWVSWASTAIDVTLITAAMVVYVVAGDPLGAVNNRIFFESYFFVLITGALRYDWRLCLFATLLALAEFLGLSAFITSRWSSAAATEFSPYVHSLRIVLLAVTGTSSVVVARWARHLRLMVGTDHLTGLSQRRPFLERIEEELRRSTSDRATLSVALLDVDDFKKFNDNHGHMEGDRALQTLALRLRRSVRASDLIARFGGEEFVIAFPRMDVERAVRRVNDLREELAGVPLSIGGQTFRLTVSAGVGSWPADGDTFEAVLARVDERLYEAKRQGKDRVMGPRSLLKVADV